MSDRAFQTPSVQTTVHWSPADSPRINLILTSLRGLALIASTPIFAGDKLMAFDGDIHEWGHTTVNLPNCPPLFTRDHCIQIGEGLSRDSKGLARYANHSCDPNCGITDLIWITAMTDIVKGTEITWDYAMSEDNDWSMECACGSPNCRRIIAGYAHLPPGRRAIYGQFISSWLTEKVRPYLGSPEDRGPTTAKAGKIPL